jgi:hypothetical protein
MKRYIRITLKMLIAPMVAVVQLLLLFSVVIVQFWDYITEKQDPYYSAREQLSEFTQQFAQYWKTLFQ